MNIYRIEGSQSGVVYKVAPSAADALTFFHTTSAAEEVLSISIVVDPLDLFTQEHRGGSWPGDDPRACFEYYVCRECGGEFNVMTYGQVMGNFDDHIARVKKQAQDLAIQHIGNGCKGS